MKGLLIKDFYILIKQIKVFLIVMVIMAVMPGNSMAAFAIIYATMLPIAIMGYDERSKWDRYALMLPYSKTNLVLSKYVMGYICITVATVFTTLSRIVFGLVKKTDITFGILTEIIPIAIVALFFLAVNLFFMFGFGVEKGRLAFFATSALVIAALYLLFDVLQKNVNTAYLEKIIWIIPVVIVLLNVVSVYASVKCYNRREL